MLMIKILYEEEFGWLSALITKNMFTKKKFSEVKIL